MTYDLWPGGKYNIQSLLNSLKDKNPFIRRQAIKSLEELGDKSVIPALIEVMLKDDISYLRHAATSVFQRKLADRSAVPALIEALKDKNLFVRGAAAAALGKIKDRSAVAYLCEALKDKEAHVRWAAAFPLGQIGDKSAIPALRELLNNPQEPTFVKSAAITALKQLGEEKRREAAKNNLNCKGYII